jgi:cell division septation protein DedD
LEILPSPAPGAEDTQGDGAVLSAAQGGMILQPAAAKPAPATPAATPAPAAPEKAAPAPVAAPASASGSVAVHLASFRSEERARIGWTELQDRHAALKGLEPRISRIDIPGQGTYYRLLAGPVTDRAAAEALCGRLTTQYCKPSFGGN